MILKLLSEFYTELSFKVRNVFMVYIEHFWGEVRDNNSKGTSQNK